MAWRKLWPFTMNTTISAMFIAWSATRSSYFETKRMRIARVIVVGSSIM